MQNLFTVAVQVGVLFVLMAAGAACRWFKLLEDTTIRGMVNVLLLIVTPCLIMDVFQRPFDVSQLRGLGMAFALASLNHVALIAVAQLVGRRSDEARRCVLRVATVFSNAGFMGLPLQQAVLGADGVFYGAVYVAVFNLFMWSWGLVTMRRGSLVEHDEPEVGRLRSFVRATVNPGTVGIAVGMTLFCLPVELPKVLRDPIHLLAGLNTPVAMLVIGYYFAGARLGPVLRLPVAWLATALRLLIAPLALTAVLYLMRGRCDRTMLLAIVTASSAPVAAMTTMFASRYRRDVDLSVALVSGTTLLSIVTMPVVIALAMEVL